MLVFGLVVLFWRAFGAPVIFLDEQLISADGSDGGNNGDYDKGKHRLTPARAPLLALAVFPTAQLISIADYLSSD
jgi:hypothetical protein